MKSLSDIDDFNKLSDYQQQHLLFNKGTLLESELCGNLIFVIYSIDLFLVEIMYDLDKDKFISRRAFLPENDE